MQSASARFALHRPGTPPEPPPPVAGLGRPPLPSPGLPPRCRGHSLAATADTGGASNHGLDLSFCYLASAYLPAGRRVRQGRVVGVVEVPDRPLGADRRKELEVVVGRRRLGRPFQGHAVPGLWPTFLPVRRVTHTFSRKGRIEAARMKAPMVDSMLRKFQPALDG